MILDASHLKKYYKKNNQRLAAVNDVSFSIDEGECVGIIGESGSGKSTLANIIAGFEKPDGGEVFFQANRLAFDRSQRSRLLRRDMQMVFQHPSASFQPNSTVLDGVCDGIRYIEKTDAVAMQSRAKSVLSKVGIPDSYFHRLCCELSGGECQRVAIARAISGHSKLVLLDEVTSALDVSIQAQVLHLLRELQNDLGVSYLFISHDIAVVAGMCDRVMVMRDGSIIESGTPCEIIHNPKEEYTEQLVRSVLTL